MPLYRRKASTVQAAQWDGDNVAEISRFAYCLRDPGSMGAPGLVRVLTAPGKWVYLTSNVWVVCTPTGVRLLDSDEFLATYESEPLD
jgi:hypothetical protein